MDFQFLASHILMIEIPASISYTQADLQNDFVVNFLVLGLVSLCANLVEKVLIIPLD